MSKGKFDYVRNYEEHSKCLPNSWIVVRLNGKGFRRFAELHGFEKPNDKRAIELMTRAASGVMEELREITIAFGASDEYSFVFRKDAQLYNRRHDKILSIVSSQFSTAFMYHWNNYFPFTKLLYPPSFDGRVILYPTDKNLRDYLSWRQADVHVSNIYNTAFWALVLKKKFSFQQAEERIRNTSIGQKIEILGKELDLNYNSEPPLFRKGTTLIRKLVPMPPNGLKQFIFPLTVDIIGEAFWKEHPEIIGMKSMEVYNKKEGDLGFLVPHGPPFPHGDEVGDIPNQLGPNLPNGLPPPCQGPLQERPMKIIKQNNLPDRMIRRNTLDQCDVMERRDPGLMNLRNTPLIDPLDSLMYEQRDGLMLNPPTDVPMTDFHNNANVPPNLRRDMIFQRRSMFFPDRPNLPNPKPRDYPVFNRRGSGPMVFSR